MTVDQAPTDAPGTRWGRVDTVLWRRSFGTVIVDVGTGQGDDRTIVELSGSAVEIWDLLDRATSLDELVEALRARFTIDAEQLEPDVRTFLDQMEEQGVVRRV